MVLSDGGGSAANCLPTGRVVESTGNAVEPLGLLHAVALWRFCIRMEHRRTAVAEASEMTGLWDCCTLPLMTD